MQKQVLAEIGGRIFHDFLTLSEIIIPERTKKIMEFIFYLFAFWLGGTVYQTLELWWRRRTHWTMFLAGGVCEVLLEFLCNGVFFALPLPFKFSFGCVVNLKMGMKVWDYSNLRGNILGQVCPYFSALWCVLSLPALLLLNLLHTAIV